MKREFSAGGVVVRRLHGRWFLTSWGLTTFGALIKRTAIGAARRSANSDPKEFLRHPVLPVQL